MRNKIKVFVKGCRTCEEVLEMLEIGKCSGCELIVLSEEEEIKKYNIKVFPTIIINDKIKIEGKPNFPLICSEELYRFLEKNYSIN
ncbi:hypothetical protein HRbin06_00332 [archaeon HR06]|nr:hypothetical protein HRbin06_00332 [archaeon HR06]